MKMTKNCPLCYQEIFSDIGKGCKMCGMPLEDKSNEFCSKTCRIKFNKIKKEFKLKALAIKLAELNLVREKIN